ncbi:hypothetical protein CEUSTIGMA_g3541.t1 [Chlamydomonas eustigma]|uniref:Membrin n=1 Tax=Chlamydomonas eustigma TaxID=1157962 RepID=A0A250WZ29_9CHLO|nr:hypothetical protein CEUSTIGMA_g3541.t1 [Chlamydomonas eustigma]|eukprot:GAX76098.1 hypothetical protein CEUSTIGMA_g3541.t1 [Chlamydomonas eustigma]
MGEVNTLHAHAKRLILGLREGLENLETSESTSRQGELGSLSQRLRAQFTELQRTSVELENVWRMYVIRENNSKRDVWKRKVEQIAEEVHTLRISLDKFGTREQRRMAEKEQREELLSRADAGKLAKQEMDAEAQMSGSVLRSKRALEEIEQVGNSILLNMAGSRERLKRAHRKVMDIINSVGLGESLLKLIEKRQRMDICITYGGMVIVLILTGLLLWWAWF